MVVVWLRERIFAMRCNLSKKWFSIVLFVAAVLNGCSEEQSIAPGLSIAKPSQLRNIDNSVLSVLVRIDEGGYEFIGEQRLDGTWVVRMNVPGDKTYNFVASWYANAKQQRVLLLEQRGQFYAGSDDNVETTRATEDTSVGNGFDADCDGLSNLYEVENSSDPLSIPTSCSSAVTGGQVSSGAQASYTDIALGGHNVCVVDTRGQLECITDSDESIYLPPANSTRYQKVESGQAHSCAITNSGQIRCWGSNSFGQTDNIPQSTAGFIDLSAGENHTCALDANGQSYCWGLNSNGQTDSPIDSQGFRSIHAGAQGTCAIRSSGNTECWSTDANYLAQYLLTNRWTDFVFPSAGNLSPACGLTTTGIIDCWIVDVNPRPPMAGPYSRIESSDALFCGLKTDGVLDCSARESALNSTDSDISAILSTIRVWPPLVKFELMSGGLSTSNGVCGIDVDGGLHCTGSALPVEFPRLVNGTVGQ